MKVPRYLQSFAGIFQLCLFLITMYLIWLETASAAQVESNIISSPSLIDVLAGVLKERGIIQTDASSKPFSYLNKAQRKTPDRPPKSDRNTKNSRTRSDLLRQELLKETQDNCLAKLLCGPEPPGPTRPSLAGDFGTLVKNFFDIFDYSDDPADPEVQKPTANKKKNPPKDDEDAASDDDEEEEENDTEGRSEPANIVSISGSIGDFGNDAEADVVTTSTSATVTEVTTGATLSGLSESTTTGSIDMTTATVHKMTLEELIGGDVTLTPEAFDRLRRSRSMLLAAGEPKQSTFIKRKIRELRMAGTETKKLKIARQIASSMRQPEQCRKFQDIASHIISTCPLTSEVVKYFNSNLKNGSQIAIINNAVNATTGGLVLLNDQHDRPHAYFLDSNPIIANTKIVTDIKNPTVPPRYPAVDLEYQIYENTFPQIKDVSKVSLAKAPIKPKDKDEDTDSGENEDDEDDDDDGNEEEEDEEENNDEDDQNEEEGQNDIDDEPSRERASKKRRKNQKPQQEQPPRPSLPSGIIKVYGVPQPSFDNEFSQTSTQIGSGPIVLFDQDDFDANDPHPGPPVRPPRPRPVKTNPQDQRRRSQIITPKPAQYSSEESDENYDNDGDEENSSVYRSSPPSYMPHPYGGPPPPRQYYRNGMPPRARQLPYRAVGSPINIRPESSVRGRLNYFPNPGAGLLRPGYPNPNYRYFGK